MTIYRYTPTGVDDVIRVTNGETTIAIGARTAFRTADAIAVLRTPDAVFDFGLEWASGTADIEDTQAVNRAFRQARLILEALKP